MNIFTTAREAVWAAIDNYGPLKDTFTSKFRYASAGARARTSGVLEPSDEDREPTATTQCPAILIIPSGCTWAWRNNQFFDFQYRLSISVWGQLSADGIEGLLADLSAAIYASKAPDAANSYIREATSGQMPLVEPWTITATKIGDPDADDENRQSVMLLTGGITLPLRYQPVNYVQ